VSNVSHGLPGRPALNATFLAMAAGNGLNAAIINPADADAMRAVAAVDVLLGRDGRAERWIARVAAAGVARTQSAVSTPGELSSFAGAAHPDTSLPAEGLAAAPPANDVATRLATAVERGDADSAPGLVEALIAAGTAPQSVIADVLTPAIQRLGDAYGRGEAFLPQLIAAAGAMKAAVDTAKARLPEGERAAEGRVVFGTVKGDIHSIGKDICISMLESQGFAVDDLGVDVAPERFVEAAADADVVCLSALMTTTLPAMAATASALAERAVPVLVGGAVVTKDYATSIGAGYSSDAPGCVAAVRDVVESGRNPVTGETR
jgi:5-methyltetrahydrofolate--homocysteine methyltransferase